MRSLRGSFLVFAALVMLTPARAVTISTADGSGADTWLNYWNQGGNYGLEESFLISKDRVPYIKLDMSSIGSDNITDADFLLYANPGDSPIPSYDYSFAIFGLLDGSDDWQETALTYANAPVIMNPITWNPLLRYLGRVNYTTTAPDLMTMQHTGGEPLTEFLNNRGPDNQVTLIIASDKVTAERFFSTKDKGSDGSKASFITFEIDPTPAKYNNWVGTNSNDWHDPQNWTNESGSASVPGADSTVNITSGANLPVVIDSDAYAKKVFVHAGGLVLQNGILSVTDGVLRVKDGVQVDIAGGQIALEGNVEGLMWGIIGTDRIITSLPCQKEVYAQAVDVEEEGSIVTTTWIGTREIERRLSWANSIVKAEGTLKYSGDPTPPSQSRSAIYCVDRSGMIGAESHVGSIGGGGRVSRAIIIALTIWLLKSRA
jgi:hypothetical protein